MVDKSNNFRWPRPQFRLRMLLLLVLIASAASVPLADWWNRPTGPLHATLRADGSLLVDGTTIAPSAITELLSKKRRALQRYDIPLTLSVAADPAVHAQRIVELLDASREAGFESFSLHVSDIRQLQQFEAAASPAN